MFRRALDLARLEGTTLVPVPPSKRRWHPQYDDRMVRVVEKVCEGTRLDWRELVVSTGSRETRHGAGGKPRIHELRRCLAVDRACASPAPKEVLLFDDVLTSGATFKACKMVLREAFPGFRVVGCFVARRVICQRRFFNVLKT